jgi:hypothetical protein
MARLNHKAGNVSADLRTFESRRWIKEALDEGDVHLASLARHLTRTEIYKHWYAITVIAPAWYRKELWRVAGQRDGEQIFDEVMHSRKVFEAKRAAARNSQIVT